MITFLKSVGLDGPSTTCSWFFFFQVRKMGRLAGWVTYESHCFICVGQVRWGEHAYIFFSFFFFSFFITYKYNYLS
ncbi:hypothetical protein Hdeb2414_s0052g00752661 [Helianthus debilis subsp. tardiflorus]